MQKNICLIRTELGNVRLLPAWLPRFLVSCAVCLPHMLYRAHTTPAVSTTEVGAGSQPPLASLHLGDGLSRRKAEGFAIGRLLTT